MMSYAVAWCAVSVLAALWQFRRDVGGRRLVEIGRREIRPAVERIGIQSYLSQARAHISSGGLLADALRQDSLPEHVRGRPGVQELKELMAQRALDRESAAEIRQVAVYVDMVSCLSEMLGCEAGRCLSSVAAAHRRLQLLRDLKSNVFAVPKATVRLLSGLPIATLVFSQLVGARPVVFLVSTREGLVCLAIGGCAYCAGMVWTRRLMRMKPAADEMTSIGTVL
ncbi:MAG: hypothetical protein LKI88_02245 [Bifidobacterium sp.]|jgi:tight adherence protein B|nr:hypothetical protein [Bifidobacterium sp.]MCI1864745.1 hypothetical protein [Bifidobacterium sp.]